MEKPKFVRNGGGIKLPIGFRFHPTDEELVVHYLKRKVYSFPLPASVIPEVDVFQTNPWDLPGDSREKRYFFCKRKSRNVNKSKGITTGSGYWKTMGKDKYIVAPGSNYQAVGVKKSLVFCESKRPSGSGLRTHWLMHEYRLVDSQTTPNSTLQLKFMMEMEDWVVCSIYEKKRKSKNNGVQTQVPNSNKNTKVVGEEIKQYCIMDLMMEDSNDSGPPEPSSSSLCSSGITDDQVSSKGSSDGEEINQPLH